jgi:hypothetical protein
MKLIIIASDKEFDSALNTCYPEILVLCDHLQLILTKFRCSFKHFMLRDEVMCADVNSIRCGCGGQPTLYTGSANPAPF